MDIFQKLVALLADGKFHSGQDMAAALGVSRTAVWKQVNKLAALGAGVQAVRGRGYRVPGGIDRLDHDRLAREIDPARLARLRDLQVHPRLDSTSTRLLQRAARGAPAPAACLAECQTGGRGRRGRQWMSPFGSNLYLSLAWPFDKGLAEIGATGLVAGLAVIQAIEALGGSGLGIKWPNDILHAGGKLAGVLVEARGEMDGPSLCVIGIGLNLRLTPEQVDAIDQPVTDLATLLGGEALSRNRIAGLVIDRLVAAMERFEGAGLEAFLAQWERYDLMRGRTVDLHLPGETRRGQVHGIDTSGALLLEANGAIQRFHSGEISLRPVS